MKKSTIITIVAFVLGLIVLTTAFILLTDNNISRKLKATTTETTTTPKPSITTSPREDYQPMDMFELDVTEYVTLGDYKNMTIETTQTEISAEDLEMQIKILLAFDKEYTPVREGSIVERVIFCFDYTGYLLKDDGTKDKTFDGGTGVDKLAYIDEEIFYTLNFDTSGNPQGIGTFVDGFAQGIINKNIGETFDIPVTFPTDYTNADLAGKSVVFEIKLKHIADTLFTDGWVKEYTSDEYKTCDEYREYLEKAINDSYKQSNISLLWKKIIENAVIEIPEQQFNYMYYNYRYAIEDYAVMFGMTYEEFFKTGYVYYLLGVNLTTDDELKAYVNEMITNDLIMLAIVDAENLTATDEEYNLLLDTLVTQTGKTKEELVEMYGEDYIRMQVVLTGLDDKIYDLNTFVLKAE